mgnify:CR=1 FL=1
MQITIPEVNLLVLALRHDPDPARIRNLYRLVLEAVEQGAQDARLLANAALLAEKIVRRPGPAGTLGSEL